MATAGVSNVFPQLNQLINAATSSGFRGRGKTPSENAALPALLATAGKGAPARASQTAETAIADQFDALTYSARMERVSLAAEFEKVRARIAAANEDAGEAQAQAGMEQLVFSFFAESRYEELAIFQQRTSKVANGLEGARQQSFVLANRQMSARFSISLTMSGAALNGFAGAAEALQNGDSASFDQFMGFAQDVLAKLDDIASEIFSLMHDLIQGGGELQERIQSFIEQLRALGLLGGGETSALPANGESSSPIQVQAQSMTFQLEFEFEYIEIVQVQGQAVQESDPVVLDLDGDGIELSSYRDGARFDITGTGKAARTAFVTGGDAFLAIDRNANGRIDSGAELFGDQNGAANGFEELRKLDSNGDGRINRLDDRFSELLLWKDDGDGETEDGELTSLDAAGIEEISLAYRNVNQTAAGGNRLEQLASFVRKDGSRGTAADAILNFIA